MKREDFDSDKEYIKYLEESVDDLSNYAIYVKDTLFMIELMLPYISANNYVEEITDMIKRCNPERAKITSRNLHEFVGNIDIAGTQQ